MSERIHALAQHLLGKPSIEECSLEEIQHLTKRYPFFAPAQFLLLQKLKATGSPDAVAQQRKALLYFHDPLQFESFLTPEKFATADLFFESKEEAAARDHQVTAALPQDLVEDETWSVADAAEIIDEPASVSLTQDGTLPETAVVFPEPDIVREHPIEPATEPAVLPVAPLPGEPRFTETKVSAEEASFTQPEPAVSEEKAPAEATTAVEEKRTLLNLSPLNTSAGSAGGALLFEPYHTVDYFASQGIKITAEDPGSTDKLSKQLRSFTDWLKVMKRLPAAEMAHTPQSTAEKSVENMASHSVAGNEVVTETMAEVWAKQGAWEKAIETYNKLSLLNPSKKAYFAAKIENLKGS